jgi:hypothetical protein
VYVASSREMRYIHLSAGKLFFGCRTRFSLANLPKLLCAVVGADVSTFFAIIDEESTQLLPPPYWYEMLF